jgi:sodium pump decarboxylase gamma subunit
LLDKIEFGLQVMVIGFVVVMIILYVLYLILIVFSRIFGEKAAAGPNAGAAPAKILEEASAAPVAAATSRQDNRFDGDIAAVITAAVAASLDTSGREFAIGSKEPALPGAQAPDRALNWSLAGRERLMERRRDLFLLRREKRI